MTDELVEKIKNLPDEVALEAGQLFTMELGIVSADDLGALGDDPLLADPQQHVDELAELARVLLLSAATDEVDRDAAARSVDGAGRKQFILGGAEIVLLAGLLVTAYRAHRTGGKKKESRTVTSETRPDGTTVTTINETVEYDTSNLVADLLKQVH
jgi:hypothetical protein